MILRCGSGLFVGEAEDGCSRYCVGPCGRVACPTCGPARARDAVQKYAPRLGDLSNLMVLMLSVRNVEPGKLARAFDELRDAMRRLRASPWFKSRWNAGLFAVEVTAGRPPRELWPVDANGRAHRPTRGEWWHPHAHVIVGNLDRDDDYASPLDCGCERWPCAHVAQFKDELQAAWKRALGVDYEPIVWLDKPYVLQRTTDDARQIHERKVYADDALADDPTARTRIFEAAAREAIKYVVKGVDSIPAKMLPELIVAKESRRWLQSFGKLHGQGEMGCRACRDAACAKCNGASWRKRERGARCSCCGSKGETLVKLNAPEPWCCDHGHELRFAGFIAPPFEQWVMFSPIGMLLPRKIRPKTGPPARSLFEASERVKNRLSGRFGRSGGG